MIVEEGLEILNCIKCGTTKGNFAASYHVRSHRLLEPKTTCGSKDFSSLDEEHIHKYCKVCGYDWVVKINPHAENDRATGKREAKDINQFRVIFTEVDKNQVYHFGREFVVTRNEARVEKSTQINIPQIQTLGTTENKYVSVVERLPETDDRMHRSETIDMVVCYVRELYRKPTKDSDIFDFYTLQGYYNSDKKVFLTDEETLVEYTPDIRVTHWRYSELDVPDRDSRLDVYKQLRPEIGDRLDFEENVPEVVKENAE